MIEVEKLKEQINGTEKDSQERHDLIFELIDNYKGDETVVPFFIDLIKKEKFEEIDSTLIYAINEYSLNDSVPYLELFIKIVSSSNFVAAWSAGGLIDDLRNNDLLLDIDTTSLKKCYKILVKNFTPQNSNIEIIKDIIFYFEEDKLVQVKKRMVPN